MIEILKVIWDWSSGIFMLGDTRQKTLKNKADILLLDSAIDARLDARNEKIGEQNASLRERCAYLEKSVEYLNWQLYPESRGDAANWPDSKKNSE